MSNSEQHCQFKWTCFICKTPAPDHSLNSLVAQEKSEKSEIFIDGNYKLYLRCPVCKQCFRPSCCEYELELHITGELKGTFCGPCATKEKEGPDVLMMSIQRLSSVQCDVDSASIFCPVMKVLNIKTNDGTEELEVSDEVANLVMSKSTDPAVKTMVIKSLIQNKKEQPSCSKSSTSSSSGSLGSPSPAASPLSSSFSEDPSPCTSAVHNWKGNEEDMFVSLRHDKHDLFLKSRNHNQLWKEICTELNAALKCNITPTQELNNYHNLKKRGKEIVDAGTGTETKFFQQKEAFDQMYGTRASTKPAHEIDTLPKKNEELEEGKNKHVKGKAKQKTKKNKKSTQIVEILEKHNTEFHEKVTELHDDKMKRIDRLLDLYELDLSSRKKVKASNDEK